MQLLDLYLKIKLKYQKLNDEKLKFNLNKIINSTQFHIRIANKKNRKIDLPIFNYFTNNIYPN